MASLQELFGELGRARALLAVAVDRRLRHELELPLVLFEPMSVIAQLDSCRVQDVAAELSVTSGGASKLVDRLEASGYCHRRPNPGDRRSSLLQLTQAGWDTFQAAARATDDELHRLLGSALPATQVRQLTVTLRRLRSCSPSSGPPRLGPPRLGPPRLGPPRSG
jgi:DNA-binding MarR family transcriptional regulator